jgi:hypothetical protein
MTHVERLPDERCWTLFGLHVTSPHRFRNRLSVSERAPDLYFRPVDASPIGAGWRATAPAYRSPLKIDDEQHVLDIVITPRGTVFHFSEVVDFYVLDDGVAYVLLDPAYAHMVELHFLGYVMSYWLERAGWLALHASAVVSHGHAIGFLSNHGGGKTSLAATLIAHGLPLLTDDILAVRRAGPEVVGLPGYPQMRMWPELARHFLGHDDLEIVHPGLTKRRVPVGDGTFGSFDTVARELAVLYIPRRREDGPVEIADLSSGAALFELVRHTFLHGVVQNSELSQQRLRALGAIVERIPIRTLAYPSGLDRLPEVARVVLLDADRHRSPTAS